MALRDEPSHHRAASGRGRWVLADAHERFLADPEEPLDGAVRPLVADSWRRSVRLGVDPLEPAPPMELDAAALRDARGAHPLAPLMPLVRDLLTADAEDAGHIVAVGDATGRLLWVEGHHGLRSRAERMRFVEGALWSERGAGTNAPGTALALRAPVQIAASEHFGAAVHSWSCVAAPVRDLRTGEVIGVVDLTGRDDVAGPRSLALVRACAAALEAQLLVTRPPAPRRPPHDRPGARLELLGTDAGLLRVGGAELRLSRRHTEIVWLLARAHAGMTVQALDAALHPDGEHLVTVRAEVARLRRLLSGAGVSVASRPYRLQVELATDAGDVRRLLGRGAVRKAMEAFAGPPLPGSDAPAVVQAREELVAEVRAAVLRSRSVPVLEAWTGAEAGHDDAEAWRALEAALPYGSPKRSFARAHRRRLATSLQPPRS